jgi:hypothetical protein
MTFPPDAVVRPNCRRNKEVSVIVLPGKLIVEPVLSADGELQFAVFQKGKIEYRKNVDGYSPVSWMKQYVGARGLRFPSEAKAYGETATLAEDIRSYIRFLSEKCNGS